jgi:acetyltransferase-like isoleucine patch superfamily enzyme
MIDNDVILGKDVKIFNPALVNIFGCTIGDYSFVGPFVEITRNTVIGKKCIIESHSFLCDSVILEDNVFVGHGVVFTNDLFPQVGIHVKYLKTLVRSGVSLGSNATILAGITIGKNAVIGAGAVVTKDVPDYSIVAGNPAKIIRSFSSAEQMTEYFRSKQELSGTESC